MKLAPTFMGSRIAVAIAAAGLLTAPLAQAQTQLPPPSYGTADTRQDRIEELEGQLRDSEARNEDTQRQLIEANREITRLRAMVGELSSVNQSLGAADPNAAAQQPPPAPPPQTQQRSDATPPSTLNGAQQRATGQLGTVPANQVTTPPPEPTSEQPGPLYSRARELLNNGRLAEAEEAFSQFLAAYPQHESAADARYWYPYTQLARNEFQPAANGFVDYLRRYPNGARAPDAQVRLGMALAGLGNKRQACAAWADIPTRYPRAPQRVRDDAGREARAAQC